jgi:hypothetical protein
MYPDSAPLLPLVVMLVDPRFPDEVKTGIASAMVHGRGSAPEISEALSVTLCRSLAHVRPFVTTPSDIESFDRAEWFRTALSLAISVTRALAERPGGQAIIQERLADEPNSILAEWVRGVLENPRR